MGASQPDMTITVALSFLSAGTAGIAAVFWGASALVELPPIENAGAANWSGKDLELFARQARKAARLSQWGATAAAVAALAQFAATALPLMGRFGTW